MNKKIILTLSLVVLILMPFSQAYSEDSNNNKSFFSKISLFFKNIFTKSIENSTIEKEVEVVLNNITNNTENLENVSKNEEIEEGVELKNSPKYFEVINEQDGINQYFLIYEASLESNADLIEPEAPTIYLKSDSTEALRELGNFFDENNVKIIIGLTDDMETLTTIRRSLGVSVMLKNARGARSQSAGIIEEEKESYSYIEVHNENENVSQYFLIYEASLGENFNLIEPEAPTIYLKSDSTEALEELKQVFNEKGINSIVVFTEDTDIGTTIRRSLGVSVMVKFGEGARSQ